MSSVQIADQTFIAAPPAVVGNLVANTASWLQWWPALQLTVREARGDQGIRWGVAGQLRGTMEIWLQPELDGVILHYFLHAEPGSTRPAKRLDALRRAYRVTGARMAFGVKAAAEAGRAAGVPAVPLSTGRPAGTTPGSSAAAPAQGSGSG